MVNIKHIYITALAAAAFLTAFPVYAQSKAPPQWVNESWRAAQYPQKDWYTGFSSDAVGRGANVAEIQKRVENEARSGMSRSIYVHVVDTSESRKRSEQAGNTETISREYEQMIQVSTTAEIVKAELYSFHDQANNKVYAFAAVKKFELANYYASRIDSYLRDAENAIALAKQLVGNGRKGAALENLGEGKKRIDEAAKLREILLAIDAGGLRAKQFSERGAALLREVSAMQLSLRESGAIFVKGKETMRGEEVSRAIPALRSKLSENKCRVANKPEDAGYILTVSVKECNQNQGGQFHYCCACVTAEVVDAKTGKNEADVNFAGPKVGWTNAKTACEKAFDEAVNELWKNIQSKTEICK